MRTKLCLVLTMLLVYFYKAEAQQRPFFNKSKDILITQFDGKPDPDDIHAQAATGCMLHHTDLQGVNYYAVAGAIGKQGGNFIESGGLMDMAFGQGNWTHAIKDKNGSINRIADRVIPILRNGGKVWVAEAGQSNITKLWVEKAQQAVGNATVKNNVVVVQHSPWNIYMADHNNGQQEAANTPIMDFIRANTSYFYIDNGNAPTTAGWGDNGPWQTPEYRSEDRKFLDQATNASNPNAKARQLWTEANRVARTSNEFKNGSFPTYTFLRGKGSQRGNDYSDTVEIWWIFNIGNNANSVTKFWSRYVTNTSNQITPNPSGGTTPPTSGGCEKTFEEKNGIVAVEAEDFVKQSKTSVREWFVIDANTTNTPKPDRDGADHANTASGGKYLEILPDTRVTHSDPLIVGQNFMDTPGEMAVIDYKIKFNSPGKYFVWVRAWAPGPEDNGVHVGINGTWPASGRKMQWCGAGSKWAWESKQRTAANHCGEPRLIYLDIPSAGVHTISFSMREDGFEMDKFILSKAYTKPSGNGATPAAVACNNPTPPTTGSTANFDFGTATSPLQSNYTRITQSSSNWTNTSGLDSRFRGTGPNDLNRDFVFSASARTFEHTVPNGNYNVVITFGDRDYARSGQAVKAEGVTKASNVSSNANQFVNRSFQTTVSDGKLSLEFSTTSGVWCVTRVTIAPVSTPPPSAGGNTFYIVNKQTKKKLRPVTDANGSEMMQVAGTATGNYVRWEKIPTTGNFFYLRNVQTKMYFRPATTLNGSILEQRPTSYSGNFTQWEQINTNGNFFYLKNKQTKMYFRPNTDAVNSRMAQRPLSYSGDYTQWEFVSTGSTAKLSTSKTAESSFKVISYGNPTKLNISTPNSGNLDMAVFDLTGRSVLSRTYKVNQGETSVDLSDISNGIYIVKITYDNSTRTLKIVK